MTFWQQFASLVSATPANFFYHLTLLLAVEVIFALSFSAWRRYPDDDLAQRMSWAAAGIVVLQLLLLLFEFSVNSNPTLAVGILPPLQAATQTATAVLITWALFPRPTKTSHLADILLILTLALTGIMALFFTQAWQTQVSAGEINYTLSPQVKIWAGFQIVVLGGGIITLLQAPSSRFSLRPIILSILLTAALLQMWLVDGIFATGTNILVWIRLGYLLAIPLWAVFAYDHALKPLLISANEYETAVIRINQAFNQAANLIGNNRLQPQLNQSMRLVIDLYAAAFVAIGLLDDASQTLKFISTLPAKTPGQQRRWKMHLKDWTGFHLSAKQSEPIAWQPDGYGAGQLSAFYKQLGIRRYGPLLLMPLQSAGKPHGLLIIAGQVNRSDWTGNEKEILPGIAALISSGIQNSTKSTPGGQMHRSSKAQITPPETTEIQLNQMRIQSLETERDKLLVALTAAENRAQLAEARAGRLQKRARAVAETLAEAKRQGRKKEQIALENEPTGPPQEEKSA